MDILVDLQVVAIAVLFYGRSYFVDGQDEGRGEVAAIGVEDGKRFVGGGWSWVGVVLGLGGEVDVDEVLELARSSGCARSNANFLHCLERLTGSSECLMGSLGELEPTISTSLSSTSITSGPQHVAVFAQVPHT